LGYRKPRMPKELENEIGTLAEPRKSAVYLRAAFVNARRRGIAELLFGSAVAALLGVQVRGGRREAFHMDRGVLGERLLHNKCAMRGVAVPDHDHRPGKMPPEMLQGDHHIRAPDGLREMPLEDAARQGQSDGRRELPALAETPQNGCLPNRCPRRTGLRLK
jgi:hypothetical protein